MMLKTALFTAVVLSNALLSAVALASEKDKYFAQQCMKEAYGYIITDSRYQGTQTDEKFSYYPIEEKVLVLGEIKLKPDRFMHIIVTIVYGWGERKKIDVTCEHTETGGVKGVTVGGEHKG